MHAYVKNLNDNSFKETRCSRIFHLTSRGTRVKFDPAKYDHNVTYGVVMGTSLVKHQVLLVAGMWCTSVSKLYGPQFEQHCVILLDSPLSSTSFQRPVRSSRNSLRHSPTPNCERSRAPSGCLSAQRPFRWQR